MFVVKQSGGVKLGSNNGAINKLKIVNRNQNANIFREVVTVRRTLYADAEAGNHRNV